MAKPLSLLYDLLSLGAVCSVLGLCSCGAFFAARAKSESWSQSLEARIIRVLFRRVYCRGQLSRRAYLRAVSAVISTIDDHIRTGDEAETIRSSEPPRLPSQAHDRGRCSKLTSGAAQIADKTVSAFG
jgi:hypothetical protein